MAKMKSVLVDNVNGVNFDTIKTEKVIIVGNSPSILTKELGSIIDSYDVVIRINRCVTKGFEKYIGEKTNIWATSKAAGLKPANPGYPAFVPDNFISSMLILVPKWLNSGNLAKCSVSNAVTIFNLTGIPINIFSELIVVINLFSPFKEENNIKPNIITLNINIYCAPNIVYDWK